MKTLTRFISEAKSKPAVFSFGRFNPPTTGHAKLVDVLNRLAKKVNGDAMVFTSHSNDKKKNPLNHKTKVNYLRKFFGKKVKVPDVSARTVFEIANAIYNQGYKELYMVVGSDRVREFEMLLKKYNGTKARHGFYKFDEINIVSAGERDPDADDVSGMSASKMRAAAEQGDFDTFKQGVANKQFADKLYKDVRKGMGIMEGNLPTYMIEDLITEGVYDPGIFKAVFLAGGPGSGKSTVVKKLGLNALGLKIVNTDKSFESGLKKAGQTLALKTVPADIRDPIRKKAKRMTARQQDRYIESRLGMVFDTTSADARKIKMYYSDLKRIGYDCRMVYVSASLDNAQNRNAQRARKLPPEIVEKDWKRSQKNLKMMQGIFGKDLMIITNDDTIESLNAKTSSAFSKLMSWSTTFPKNKAASLWKQRQILTKKNYK